MPHAPKLPIELIDLCRPRILSRKHIKAGRPTQVPLDTHVILRGQSEPVRLSRTVLSLAIALHVATKLSLEHDDRTLCRMYACRAHAKRSGDGGALPCPVPSDESRACSKALRCVDSSSGPPFRPRVSPLISSESACSAHTHSCWTTIPLHHRL